MFRNFFILGLVSTIATLIAYFAYTTFYYKLLVDFSEANGIGLLAAYSLMAGMCACLLNVLCRKVIKKQNIADFVFSLLFALVSIALVFIVLDAKDPDFQSEDAQLFAEFYKGFLMPMLFFPFLTWFTFRPLIIK